MAFWVLALLHLVPIWAFHFLPTQDGPAHLFNAQILKDYSNPSAGYQEFFEFRHQQLPNLSSHLLLAGLLYVFPPLVAEKLLVSLYVLGFAGSLRYFLGAFGPRCVPMSWAGLLLVYNRCFWMGFWNYCLSVILIWVILGYCLRRRGQFHPLDVLTLTLLFTAAYFTHLSGFLIAFAGALLVAVLVPPRRVLWPLMILLTALPALCLFMDYLEQTHFTKARSAMNVVYEPLARLQGQRWGKGVWSELATIDDELLAHHTGIFAPSSLILVAWWLLLVALSVVDYFFRSQELQVWPGRLFPAVFGSLLLAGFLLVPNHLGGEHGGFLKCRMALLPLLVWLGCFREPAIRGLQILMRTATAGLLVTNLLLVAGTMYAGNQILARYTAGIEAVGRGKRLYVIQHYQRPDELVSPLLHAAHYYCLGNGNVNLDNYEAGTPHFPVKYRRGLGRGRNNWSGYPKKNSVDVVLFWAVSPNSWDGPRGWEEIFHERQLRIYRRPASR